MEMDPVLENSFNKLTTAFPHKPPPIPTGKKEKGEICGWNVK